MFPPLNVINIKPYSYGIKGVIRQYHYQPDPKLDPGIFANENNYMQLPFLYNNIIFSLRFYTYRSV